MFSTVSPGDLYKNELCDVWAVCWSRLVFFGSDACKPGPLGACMSLFDSFFSSYYNIMMRSSLMCQRKKKNIVGKYAFGSM